MVTDQFISFQPRNCSGPKFVQHMTTFYKTSTKYDKLHWQIMNLSVSCRKIEQVSNELYLYTILFLGNYTSSISIIVS